MTADLQTGIFYAIIAGILWGIGPLLLKRGMVSSNVSAATLIEQIVSVAAVGGLAALQGEIFHPALSAKTLWPFVAAGAVGASFGKIFYYQGIDKVGASKSTAIKNSSPLLTVVLAIALLGEELTLAVALGSILIVTGILVLTRVEVKGDERPGRIEYFFYPLMAAIGFGINPIFKKMGVDALSLPTIAAAVTQVTALAVILTLGRFLKIRPKWERVPAKSLVYFTLAGFTEGLGSLFTFYALIYAPAVVVSPIWRTSPLVTFGLAHFTLRGIEVVTLRDGLAATFIVGGVFVLSQG